jgi:AraC-like DNA-binding protein
MDALGALLNGPRARGAFMLRVNLSSPWSLRIEDEAPIALIAVASGEAWLVPDSGDAVALSAGDVALARGPDHYGVADTPTTRPQVIIHPGQRCTTLAGDDLAESTRLGVRTWGNSADGPTTLLVGAYTEPGEIGGRALAALPQFVIARAGEVDGSIIRLLHDELSRDHPGQEAVLDRILDLLLITTMRSWFSGAQAQTPPWYAAQADPVVGRALRLIHNSPAHPWTISGLATETYVSRAGLARRFKALIGEPPMTYLTRWRLSLAIDLMHGSDATLADVARQVGYGSPFALSAAFKRVHGVSPSIHRQRSALAADGRRTPTG